MSFISKFNSPSSTFYIILLSFALILSMSITVMQFNNFIKSLNPYSLLSSSSFLPYDAFGQYSIAPTAPGGPSLADPNLKAQLVFPGSTKGTTSMAFLGPNDILVLEKNTGKVDRIVNGKLLPNPVLDVAVANYIERGLLGIAISPTILSPDGKRYVYLYYTQAGNDTTDGDEFLGLAPPKGNMVYRYE